MLDRPLGRARGDLLGREQRAADHHRGRLVHLVEDRVVRRAEPVADVPPGHGRLPNGGDVAGVVDALDLGLGRLAAGTSSSTPSSTPSAEASRIVSSSRIGCRGCSPPRSYPKQGRIPDDRSRRIHVGHPNRAPPTEPAHERHSVPGSVPGSGPGSGPGSAARHASSAIPAGGASPVLSPWGGPERWQPALANPGSPRPARDPSLAPSASPTQPANPVLSARPNQPGPPTQLGRPSCANPARQPNPGRPAAPTQPRPPSHAGQAPALPPCLGGLRCRPARQPAGQPGSGPVATGRSGSPLHSDHEPTYSPAGASALVTPATSSASTTDAAVTPEPQ